MEPALLLWMKPFYFHRWGINSKGFEGHPGILKAMKPVVIFSKKRNKGPSKGRSWIVCWTSRGSPDDYNHEYILIAIADAMIQAAKSALSILS